MNEIFEGNLTNPSLVEIANIQPPAPAPDPHRFSRGAPITILTIPLPGSSRAILSVSTRSFDSGSPEVTKKIHIAEDKRNSGESIKFFLTEDETKRFKPGIYFWDVLCKNDTGEIEGWFLCAAGTFSIVETPSTRVLLKGGI